MINEIQEPLEAEIVVEADGLSVAEPIVMDAQRARHLTNQIRQGLEITWTLIVEVYSGQAWKALGHSSWGDYCVKEFGNQHLAKALPRGERDELFIELREAGLSTRAIATATGASQSTVNRAISGESFDSPVAGEDNKTYKTPPKRQESQKASPNGDLNADGQLDGQSDITDVLDEPITDFGIEPVNTDELLAKNAKNRRSAVRKLISGSGTEQAPLPMVISLAGQVAITPDDAENLDQEETITLFEEGSRGVVVLAQLMKTLDAANLDDPQTRRAVRANLNSCQEFIDEVLTVLEGS